VRASLLISRQLLLVHALFVTIAFLSAVVSTKGAPLKMWPLLFAIEALFVLPLIVVNIVIVSAALTIAAPLKVVSLVLVFLKTIFVGIVIVIVCPIVGKLLLRIATIIVLVVKISVVGLVTLSHLHLNLPLIKRTLTIHLFYSLNRFLLPHKLNVRKPTTIPSLVVLNHVH